METRRGSVGFPPVALRAKANSVRSNPNRCASKGGQLWQGGSGGSRSAAEADGRPYRPQRGVAPAVGLEHCGAVKSTTVSYPIALERR